MAFSWPLVAVAHHVVFHSLSQCNRENDAAHFVVGACILRSASCAFPHQKTPPQRCPSADLTEWGVVQIRRFGANSPRFCCVFARFWRLPRGRLLNPTFRHKFATLLLQFRTVSHQAATLRPHFCCNFVKFRTVPPQSPCCCRLSNPTFRHTFATLLLQFCSDSLKVRCFWHSNPTFRHNLIIFAADFGRFAQNLLLPCVKSYMLPQVATIVLQSASFWFGFAQYFARTQETKIKPSIKNDRKPQDPPATIGNPTNTNQETKGNHNNQQSPPRPNNHKETNMYSRREP